MQYEIIDADQHVIEPPDLWEKWLPKRYQAQAPKLVEDEDGGDAWLLGEHAESLGLVAAMNQTPKTLKWTGVRYEDLHPGIFEAKGRLELMDEDGVMITIPNKHIVGEIIHNSGPLRIVEASVGISYAADPRAAVEAISRVLEGIDGVAKEPSPRVGVEEFGDSSVNIGYRYWVETARYFKVANDVNMAVKEALGEARIEIPFPQRDVHIISEPEAAQA